ncbi:MAG TPA: cytochrome c3 family protein [Phycisphaerae bacterium]|nr:cytochrome c3 family protein [Phycisphaerae bacterium]
MSREWPSRIRRSRITGCAVIAALAVFCSAMAGVDPSQEQPAGGPAPAASTEPAEDASQETPPAEQRQWAREGLVSGLIGSKHDFTEGGKSGRDLCLPCHTPHLVAAPPPRFDLRPTTVLPLRPYQGMDIELTGWSLLCLGCHDGVTAPDVYSSQHAISVSGQLGNSRLGLRGVRSHPVGIRYPKVADDYNPPSAVEAAGLLLPDGRIQCTTCHDAHNTHRIRGMLKISNDRSRLCLTCHHI